jgi:hypothetical protein
MSNKPSERRKEWYEVVEATTAYLFRVVTPDGHGTGFLLATSSNGNLCGVATAFHVISRAFEWGFPIRIEHVESKKSQLLYPANRYIEFDAARDTAVIVFEKGDFPLPAKDLELTPEDKSLKLGCEVGWLGFPAITPTELCFFSGAISNWNESQHTYLVDGVAINGVSGGPVLRNRLNGDVHLVGIISAYIPNYLPNGSTPGLSVVRDVSPFFAVIKKLKDLPPPQENPPPVAPTEQKLPIEAEGEQKK